MIQLVPQKRVEERITEQVVDITLPHIMDEMMEVERSTWQDRCVLRSCTGADVVRHAFHLAQILRPLAIRFQVSSRSVVTESNDGSLPVFLDSPDFWIFPARKSSKLPRQFQLIRAGRSSSGSARSHRAFEATRQPSCFFPFVFLLRRSTPALRLGDLAGSWQRSEFYVFLRRYGCRSGQPSSSSTGKEILRPRIAVFDSWYCSLRVQVFMEFVYWDTLNFASAPGLPGGRGEMAMAVASSARVAFLRGAVCASTLYTRCCPFVRCTATVH